MEQYPFPWQEPLPETCKDLRMIMLSKLRRRSMISLYFSFASYLGALARCSDAKLFYRGMCVHVRVWLVIGSDTMQILLLVIS